MSEPDQDSMPLGNLTNLAKFHPILYKHFYGLPIMDVSIEISKELDKLAKGTSQEISSKDALNSLRTNIYRLERLCDTWLNTGHYSEVPDRLRLLYSFLCALMAKLEFLREDYLSSLRFCDEGLLKGHDLEDESLSKFASQICRHFLPPPVEIFNENFEKSTSVPLPLPNSQQIQKENLPSLEFFYTNYFLENLPVIITGMVNGWPAFEKWSFSYLNSICGHRLVPVEIGNKYTDEDWRQQLMSFNEYLINYVFPKQKEANKIIIIGYLAQHRLLDQIPELIEDLIIPEYCSFGQSKIDEEEKEAENSEKDIEKSEFTFNVFIGPSGTVSPLHTDPRHNIFCQLRGSKFVRLIAPNERENLYLYDDLMRQNSSQIDVECPDLNKFPSFSNVKCYDYVVKAGQCLFIPRGWFHHIRALEPSISVSIWFGK